MLINFKLITSYHILNSNYTDENTSIQKKTHLWNLIHCYFFVHKILDPYNLCFDYVINRSILHLIKTLIRRVPNLSNQCHVLSASSEKLIKLINLIIIKQLLFGHDRPKLKSSHMEIHPRKRQSREGNEEELNWRN